MTRIAFVVLTLALAAPIEAGAQASSTNCYLTPYGGVSCITGPLIGGAPSGPVNPPMGEWYEVWQSAPERQAQQRYEDQLDRRGECLKRYSAPSLRSALIQCLAEADR